MAADRIRVSAPGGDYDILIEAGLLQNINSLLDDFQLNRKVAIITNPTVARFHGEALARRLPNATLITMPDGEQYKSIDTLAQIYTNLMDAGLDRSGTVIALGGGVVGDTAGFAAATYMRGVRLVQIPTTLLSMVDSSVGGKVGIDLPQGKNLAGAFKQPVKVLIDPDVLKTLPESEWRCGMGEVIKHGLLADEGLLNSALWKPERAAELVRRAVQVKVDVVQQDPYEKNIRAHLNLGHTFAHAIEQVSGYRWAHGEAVGFGQIAAARLSYALNLCDADLPERVEAIIMKVGLPHRLNGLDAESIYSAMATDKKRQSGRIRFVLLRGMCQPVMIDDVPKETVINVLMGLQ